MTGLAGVGGLYSVSLSLRLEASSRVGGQLCGSWVGVPNWVQKEVGRLSSEYLDESDWYEGSWVRKRRQAGSGGMGSESGKVGRVCSGGWVASFKTPEAEPFCGMQ